MGAMKMRLIELLTAVALTLAALVAFSEGARAGDIEVVTAVAAKSLTPLATSGAVYMTLMNHGDGADRLTGISTPAAAMAMLHRSTETDGVMHMEMLETLELAPQQSIDMKMQGLHIMLTGLKQPLKPGDHIRVLLVFKNAGTVDVDAVVGG
jgi:periplasmic copper chaperone A